MNFTKQEKIDALTRLGYTIKAVDGYLPEFETEETVKVTVALWGDVEVYNIDATHIRTIYGIDNVFDKEYKRLILELFQR